MICFKTDDRSTEVPSAARLITRNDTRETSLQENMTISGQRKNISGKNFDEKRDKDFTVNHICFVV